MEAQPETPQTAERHVCGVCGDEWLTEQEYNFHECPKTGVTPTSPDHLIRSTTPEFAEVSQSAQERGAADSPPPEQPPAPEQPAPTPGPTVQ